jgi:phosphoribosylaminoimidazole-succinocarboxamide synthase
MCKYDLELLTIKEIQQLAIKGNELAKDYLADMGIVIWKGEWV